MNSEDHFKRNESINKEFIITQLRELSKKLNIIADDVQVSTSLLFVHKDSVEAINIFLQELWEVLQDE